VLLLVSSQACAAKVLIVGDLQFPFVAGIASEIRSALNTSVTTYPLAEARGRLNALVERDGAQLVVALGAEAVNESLRLPPGVPVVYGLVVTPPRNSRGRVTGVYMSTPVSEYVTALRQYFPNIGRLSVIGTPASIRTLAAGSLPQVALHQVTTTSDLVKTVGRAGESDALMLLPDVTLLTAAVQENVYAFSFKKNVPLLGISEGNVKQGALLALVFDPRALSWQIGELARAILDGDKSADLPPVPPGKYNLYVNTHTARKMGLVVPGELLRRAKRVY
jgi:ABC-type uncharacterized transport system substrate-binding protein